MKGAPGEILGRPFSMSHPALTAIVVAIILVAFAAARSGK